MREYSNTLGKLIGSFLIAGACTSCKGPSIVRTLLECRSPDGRLNAVFWWQGGGGAAGWAEEALTIVPSNIPTSQASHRSDIEGRVFRMSHGSDIRLTWQDDNTLLVDYPDSAVVNYAAPGKVWTPFAPTLKVTYRGVPANEVGALVGGSKCVR